MPITEPAVIFFYQGRTGIVGRGVVTGSGPVLPDDSKILKQLGLSDFRTRITVSEWVTFPRPIVIRAFVQHLTFIRDKRNWGASLKGSPVFIDEDDVATLTRFTLAGS